MIPYSVPSLRFTHFISRVGIAVLLVGLTACGTENQSSPKAARSAEAAIPSVIEQAIDDDAELIYQNDADEDDTLEVVVTRVPKSREETEDYRNQGYDYGDRDKYNAYVDLSRNDGWSTPLDEASRFSSVPEVFFFDSDEDGRKEVVGYPWETRGTVHLRAIELGTDSVWTRRLRLSPTEAKALVGKTSAPAVAEAFRPKSIDSLEADFQPFNGVRLPERMRKTVAEAYPTVDTFGALHLERVLYADDVDGDDQADVVVAESREDEREAEDAETAEDRHYGRFVVTTTGDGSATLYRPQTPGPSPESPVAIGYDDVYVGDVDQDGVTELFARTIEGVPTEGGNVREAFFDPKTAGEMEVVQELYEEEPEQNIAEKYVGDDGFQRMEDLVGADPRGDRLFAQVGRAECRTRFAVATRDPRRALRGPVSGVSMHRATSARTGVWERSGPKHLSRRRWERDVGTAPILHGGVLYAASGGRFSAARIKAIDAESCGRAWMARLRGEEEAGRPAARGETVYVPSVASVDDSTVGYVQAVEAKTGRERWHAQVDGFANAPAVSDSSVYVGVGREDGLDRDTVGHVRVLSADEGTTRWRARLGGPVEALAVTSETVLAGTADDVRIGFGDSRTAEERGNIYAFDAGTGQARWTFDARAPVRSIAAAGSTAYVVAYGDDTGPYLYALALRNGEERWRWGSEDQELSAPVATEGVVYIGAEVDNNPRTYALNAKDGSQKWSVDIGRSRRAPTLSMAGGRLYATTQYESYEVDRRSFLHVQRPESGQLLWRYRTDNSLESVVVGDSMAYARTGGLVYALE